MLRIIINQPTCVFRLDYPVYGISFWVVNLSVVNVGTDFRICIYNECLKVDSNTLIHHSGPLLIAFFGSMPGAPSVRQDKYNITVSEQR